MGSGFLVFAGIIILGSFVVILAITILQVNLSLKKGYKGLFIAPFSIFLAEPFKYTFTGIEYLYTNEVGNWKNYYEDFIYIIPPIYFLLIFLICKLVLSRR